MIGIYCFENSINGKKYIGQSIDLEKRYKEHKNNHLNPNYCNYNSKFYRALRKYGFENFKYSILSECSQSDLNFQEQYFITLYDSKNNGYNSTEGGEDNPSNNREIVAKRTLKLYEPEINKKLSHKGETNGNAKLTSNDVIAIRQRYAQGENLSQVYESYKNKISYSGFQSVWINKSWTDIGQEYYSMRKISNHGGSKLLESDVINIRTRYKNGESKSDIYKDYKDKIGQVGFNKIIRNVTWKNVVI